ncbi:PREDICTED: uncharacterized protein At3g43530-like [Camelina sativa]|uniref:Uncharacterized protein At3g43530-like n=1 Tax=Camelina sativa TaxID=90675 RepID=A0ABM0Z8J8_CAMSA|nr:PREDICTED: uncharacterized protein At3g43530-like [Camelina sativa]
MKEDNEDLPKIALLFFIGYVLTRRNNKAKGYIKSFFLKIVDYLSLCEVFPWGTLSFLYYLESLKDMVKKFKGPVASWTWSIPCYITHLEILPFECIALLKKKYRVDVERAASTCPRMCMTEFLKIGEKGYPLQNIYKEIGTDKEIESLLLPTTDE